VTQGVATVKLGAVPRGTAIQATVQIERPTRTLVLREATIARLRPDLVVVAVHAPAQTLSTRPIDVVADVTERNGVVSTHSVGGLPASTAFSLALWNASGNGENSLAGTVAADAAGVARFQVPLHAAFSLTTVPVS
jgi:hypothetical protein